MKFKLHLLAVAVVLAMTAGCYDPVDYSQTDEQIRANISLKVDTTVSPTTESLPADELSRLRMIVQIARNAAPVNRVIVVTTSAGTLVDNGKEGTSAEVTADPQGRATIELKSSGRAEIARVRAQVKNVPTQVAYVDIRFVPVPDDALISFTSVPALPLPADGVHVSRLEVQVPEGLATDKRQVEFSTTAGSFLGSGTTAKTMADRTGRAFVDFVVPRVPGEVTVTAVGAGASDKTSFTVIRAFADRIMLSPSSFKIQAGWEHEITMTANLGRLNGMVSPGTNVAYTANDTLGNAIGAFRAKNRTNNDGASTVYFSAGPTGYRGRIILHAVAEGSNVSDSAEVVIVN